MVNSMNDVLRGVEKEINDPMAIPAVRPGKAIGISSDGPDAYAPPTVRAQLRKKEQPDLYTLASLLVRLTYIDMITFCRGIVLDDAAEVVKLADQIHEWAAENNKE